MYGDKCSFYWFESKLTIPNTRSVFTLYKFIMLSVSMEIKLKTSDVQKTPDYKISSIKSCQRSPTLLIYAAQQAQRKLFS